MKTTLNNNTLTLYLDKRIDSVNAAELDREMAAAVEVAADADVVLDAGELEYISSAGLRILMKLRKRLNKPLPVVNVSPEVYDIFEVTGFTELLDVRKRLRQVSIEGCQELGSGANGTVYRLTRDEMIKVFRPGYTLTEIEHEREASRKAFLLGVPCAIAFDTVLCGGSYGTVYEMLNAATLTERIRANPDVLPKLAEAAAKLLKQLHEIEIPRGQMPDASRPLFSKLDKLTDDFTPEELDKIRGLYGSIPPMNRFVHNDYHSKNIMESEGELMLIDLGDAGVGNPIIDICHSYFVFNLIGVSSNTKDDDISFIGLTYGEMKRFWRIFGETYFGSAQKAAAIDEKIKPYGELMYYTSAMASPRLPARFHAPFVDRVRSQVLTRYDELLGSLA